MAASAIMTLIVLIVLTIANTVLRTWNRASGQLQTRFEGAVAGGIIKEDLESIKIKKDGKAWLQVAYPTSVGMLTGESYLDTIPLRPPEVMFYAPTMLRPRYTQSEMASLGMNDGKDAVQIPGSFCAIKYQVALKNPFMVGSGSSAENEMQYNAFYGLYRAVIDPESTALEGSGPKIQGFAQNDADYASYELALQQNLWNKTCTVINEMGVKQPGQNLRSWAVSPENMLAMNVVDFRMTFGVFYPNPDAVGNTEESTYDVAYIPPGMPFTIGRQIIVDNAYRISTGGEKEMIPGTMIRDGFLSFIDISMTIISDTGAKEMKALMKSGSIDTEKFKRLVQEFGTTISRRIQLESEPAE